MWPLPESMEATVDKCLAFCQALAKSNHKFSLNLTIDKDNFNFNNKELATGSWQMKKENLLVSWGGKQNAEKNMKRKLLEK